MATKPETCASLLLLLHSYQYIIDIINISIILILIIKNNHQISGCTFRGLDCLTTIDSDDEDSFIMDYEVNLRRLGFLLNYDPRWYGAQFTETALTFLPPMSLLENPH